MVGVGYTSPEHGIGRQFTETATAFQVDSWTENQVFTWTINRVSRAYTYLNHRTGETVHGTCSPTEAPRPPQTAF